TADAPDLLSGLQQIAGHHAKKVCPKCGQTKLLNHFCRNGTRSDGHGARCKMCECARASRLRLLRNSRNKMSKVSSFDANRQCRSKAGRFVNQKAPAGTSS